MDIGNFNEPVVISQLPKYELSVSSDLLDEGQLNGSTYFIQTVPIQSSTMQKTVNHLSDLIQLSIGWDGGDAIPPYFQSITNCLNFLYRIPIDFIEKIGTENIYPTNHGTVVVDLINNEGEKVSLEFGKTKIGFFSDFGDGFNYRLDGVIFNYNNLPPTLLSAITKLYKSYIF